MPPSTNPTPTRTPTAAKAHRRHDSGNPRAQLRLLLMRKSTGYVPVVSACPTATCSMFLSRAAVVLVAAGEVPVTLTWRIRLVLITLLV